MDFLENLKAFLLSIIAFFRTSPESDLPRTQPQPTSFLGMELHQRPTNDLEILQQDSPPSTIDLESSQPPMQPSALPSTNDPETLQPQPPLPTPTATLTNLRQTAAQQHLQWTNSVLSSPPSTINLESSQPPGQPSPAPSTTDPETLQPQPPLPTPTTTLTNLRQIAQQHLQWTNSVLSSPPSTINLESSQPPAQPSPPPSANDPETLQPQPPPPTPSTTPTNLNQIETLLAAQQHLQWINQVLSAFCFSYAVAVSLQYAQTDHQPDQLNSSFVLLSVLALLTFILILVARFISTSWTKTSQVLEKAAILVAAAAFCHTIAIPFPFELKCAVLAVFLLSLLLIAIFEYLNRNIA